MRKFVPNFPRHRLTKHYLQPGHCGLGSLLGEAETQQLGEAPRSWRSSAPCSCNCYASSWPVPFSVRSAEVQRLGFVPEPKLRPHSMVEVAGASNDTNQSYSFSTFLGPLAQDFPSFDSHDNFANHACIAIAYTFTVWNNRIHNYIYREIYICI